MGIALKKMVFEFKTKILNPKLNRIYIENRENQFISNLSNFNLEKRKAIVKHAYYHTKFYRKHYDAQDISPEKLQSDKDFESLPIITRDHLKKYFIDFISSNTNKKNYSKATTGGSTGTPITVLHDKRYPLTGIQWRILDWWCIKPFENAAFIYRLRRSGFKKLLNAFLWWPTKRIFLDASSMDKTSILLFIEEYNKIKPKLLQGYVGGVYEFALFIKDNNIRIEPPKAVWVTSAPLTKLQRKVMQDTFHAPVYDQYGTCEIMWLAAECKEQNGLHMMSDIRYIEFVDDNNLPVPPNIWGRILLTDLQNFAFPLIRYEIGDYGRALDYECSCGLKLPLMDHIKGRQSDIIKTPKGIIISGEYLTTIFDDYPDAVREFQIIQAKDYSIVLKYIPNTFEGLDDLIIKVVNDIKTRTRNQIPITTERVEKIAHFKGKTQFIISELNKT